jgi:GNAT superfamily N-acetyltransferase
MSQEIRSARVFEVPQLAVGLATAFDNDPLSAYVFPDAQSRLGAQTLFFSLYLHTGLEVGNVETNSELSGVSIWIPSESEASDTSNSHGPHIPHLDLDRYKTLLAATDSVHPEGPHDHLSFIASFVPGQGIGRALLRYHLDQLNSKGRVGYLEASSLINAGVYQQLGFQAMNSVRIINGPTFYPMIYKPN